MNGDGHTHSNMLNVVENAQDNTGNAHAQVGDVVFLNSYSICFVW